MELAGSARVVVQARNLQPGERALEFMLNALRLPGGFPLALFSERTGLDAVAIAAPLGQCVRRGWVWIDGGRITPTPEGLLYLNDALEAFLPADATAPAAPVA
jgi:oxygen-independent coproporphyrinogen-3 oxidase